MPVTLNESAARQAFVIGKETTYRTPVSGTHRFMNMKMPLKAEMETESFMAAGYTAPTAFSLNDDYATASGSGKPDFNSIPWVHRSIFGALDSTEEETGVRWLHIAAWDGKTELAPESYTAFYGKLGASTGRRSAGFVFTKFGIKNNRKSSEFTCAGIGGRVETGITMPGSPTVIVPQIMFPTMFTMFVDPTWADLGTTQVLSFLDFSFDGSDMLGRVLPINDDQSADGLVELAAEHKVSITMFANNDDEYLDYIRNGELIFVRLQATGPALGTGNYLYQQDMCIQVDSAEEYGETDSVHTIGVGGTIYNDGTSGNALEVRVENGIASY
jgi:hypothetical protein